MAWQSVQWQTPAVSGSTSAVNVMEPQGHASSTRMVGKPHIVGGARL